MFVLSNNYLPYHIIPCPKRRMRLTPKFILAVWQSQFVTSLKRKSNNYHSIFIVLFMESPTLASFLRYFQISLILFNLRTVYKVEKISFFSQTKPSQCKAKPNWKWNRELYSGKCYFFFGFCVVFSSFSCGKICNNHKSHMNHFLLRVSFRFSQFTSHTHTYIAETCKYLYWFPSS